MMQLKEPHISKLFNHYMSFITVDIFRSHKVEIRTLDQIELSGDLLRPLYEPKHTSRFKISSCCNRNQTQKSFIQTKIE